MPGRRSPLKHALNRPRLTLLRARKEYSKCAGLIERSISTNGLNPTLSEQIIGVGIALDWVRRAAEMEQILYVGDNLNTSEHKQRFTDFLRFAFAWFGLNAVFTRESLLSLVSPTIPASEFAKFKILLSLDTIVDSAVIEAELRSLLDTITTPRLPGLPSGAKVTTLKAIHLKYVPHGTHHGACANALASAANSGSAASLDLATMIYGLRNWSIHGNALDGCFGSQPRQMRYVELLTNVLADVHFNTARALRSVL